MVYSYIYTPVFSRINSKWGVQLKSYKTPSLFPLCIFDIFDVGVTGPASGWSDWFVPDACNGTVVGTCANPPLILLIFEQKYTKK